MSVHPRLGDKATSSDDHNGFMSETGTRLDRAEVDVDKAEAILDKIEQVLQAVDKLRTGPESNRVLVRTAAFVIAGGVALLGVAVIASRVRH